MQFGLCTSWNNGLKLRGACDYLEDNAQRILVGLEGEDVFHEKIAGMKEAGLPVPCVNCFIPGSLPCVGPKRDWEKLLSYCTTVVRRAGEAGIEVIVFGSGGSRSLYEGVSLEEAKRDFIEICQAIAPVAGECGVTVVIEPLNRGECNFINTVAEGAEIVKAVDHPSIRLLADIYHMARNEEDPVSGLAPYVELIHHVHIAEKEKRTAPGMAGDDFRPYLKSLKEGGYDRRISIEGKWGDGPLEDQVPGAIAELRRQWEEA